MALSTNDRNEIRNIVREVLAEVDGEEYADVSAPAESDTAQAGAPVAPQAFGAINQPGVHPASEQG